MSPAQPRRVARRVADRLLPRRRHVQALQDDLGRSRREVRRLSRRLGERERDDLGYLFVVTYGRSGSTLLQGILNAIPGYLIRGENRQAVRHLYAYHQALMGLRRNQRRRRSAPDIGPTGPADAHFGMDGIPRRTTDRLVRGLALETLLRPAPDTRVTGFKEIRWSAKDVAEYVAWLRRMFPGARFVVNTRNLDDVARSKWWAERPDAREHLAEVENRLLALADDLGDDAFRVHYDEYVADPGALRPLFDWLGEPFDEEAVRGVLDRPHSY